MLQCCECEVSFGRSYLKHPSQVAILKLHPSPDRALPRHPRVTMARNVPRRPDVPPGTGLPCHHGHARAAPASL